MHLDEKRRKKKEREKKIKKLWKGKEWKYNLKADINGFHLEGRIF